MKNKNNYDDFVNKINSLPDKTKRFIINIAYTCSSFTNPYLYLWEHYQRYPEGKFISQVQAMFGE